MAPPIPTFHVSALPSEINTLPNGKARKPPIDLENCALKEMVQYRCNVDRPKDGQRGVVICEPVVRFYRQCADVLIETTAWEVWREKQRGSGMNPFRGVVGGGRR